MSKYSYYGNPFIKPVVSPVPIGHCKINGEYYCEEFWPVSSDRVVVWRRRQNGTWFSGVQNEAS